MYFTLQPPVDIPCNPYVLKKTSLSLQCMVSAPALNAYLQEVNFTIEWMKMADYPGALEEIIYPDEGGFEVVTKCSSHMHGEAGLAMSVFVESTLSLDMNQASHMELSGKYWCRVLAKNLENYSYTIAGDSGTATLLKSKLYYQNNYPPCVEETSLHLAELKCVENGQSQLNLASHPSWITASTYKRYQDLDVIAIAGVILIVLLLTMLLCSCLNIKGHTINGNSPNIHDIYIYPPCMIL